MKDNASGLQKFLRSSRKLEDTQVMRRVKDIEDIEKFDEQKEAQKTRQLQQQTALDRHAEKYKANLFAHPEYADGEWLQTRENELNDLFALEGLAADARMAASADELGQVQELQRIGEREDVRQMEELELLQHIGDHEELQQLEELEAFQRPRAEDQRETESKQLPAASADAFTGKFAEVVDAEMQREIEDNRRALKEFEPPRLDLTPKKDTEIANVASTEEDAPLMLVNDDELQQFDATETAEDDTLPSPKRKSETVFYFRPTPNLPKE